MSTPVDLNIVMPYGVTVEGAGSRNARIVTESTQASSDIALKLPDGPCRVAASWDGPESVRLVHTGHGYPVKIPAGGGIALGWLLSALRRAKLSTCRTLRLRRLRRAGAALSRCTRSTSSSRPQGGGLGDHPEHQHRRGHGRAAGNQIVRSSDRGRERQSDRRREFLPRSAGGRFHHHGQRGAVEPGRVLGDHGVCAGALRVADNTKGADACVVERCSSRWRDALPAHQGEQCLRRGSDYHHLPAGLVAQGVAA